MKKGARICLGGDFCAVDSQHVMLHLLAKTQEFCIER